MDKRINPATASEQTEEMGLEAIKVFTDLCQLLDEYGPSWYSEAIHDRTHGALRSLEHIHRLSSLRSSPTDSASSKPPRRSFARGGTL